MKAAFSSSWIYGWIFSSLTSQISGLGLPEASQVLVFPRGLHYFCWPQLALTSLILRLTKTSKSVMGQQKRLHNPTQPPHNPLHNPLGGPARVWAQGRLRGVTSGSLRFDVFSTLDLYDLISSITRSLKIYIFCPQTLKKALWELWELQYIGFYICDFARKKEAWAKRGLGVTSPMINWTSLKSG